MQCNELLRRVVPGLPKGTFEIPQCGIYVEKQEALEPLLETLRTTGYTIKEGSSKEKSSRCATLDKRQSKRWIRRWINFQKVPPNLPNFLEIHEAWEGYPLAPSPSLHVTIIRAAGMISDCGFYYQDGTRAFEAIHFFRMHLFVKHLTTLSVLAWDEMVKIAPKDGPGFIRAAAAFCQGTNNPVFEDKPNIMNLFSGLQKVFRKETLTEREREAMTKGAADDERLRKMVS